MRGAVLAVLVVGGCAFDRGVPDIGVGFDSGGPFRPELCLDATPDTLSLSGGSPDAETRSGTITLSPILDCGAGPYAYVDGARLDDPAGAFAVDAFEPTELAGEETLPLTVRLTATEPGRYEAQVLVEGTTGGTGGRVAIEVFGEVLAEDGG